MRLPVKGSVLLIAAATLSACVHVAPDMADMPIQSGQAQNSIDPSAFTMTSSTALTASSIDQQIASDKQSIRAGLEPPDVINYDLEIAKIMPEAQAIIASHDRARANKWMDKYHSIVAARNKAVQEFLAPSIAMNNAISNVLESSRLSRGSVPSGAPGSGGGVHVCPQGPGPGEVLVATDPQHGGVPLCR